MHTATPTDRILLWAAGIILTASCTAGPATERLYTEFLNPPKENHPEVWWWFGKDAPDEAITRDLEALARVGISTFTVYDNGGGSATDSLWRMKVKWSLHEADRLGLDAILCIGSAGCGHPETSMEHARKAVVTARAEAEGGSRISVALPLDGTDVACLAVPSGRHECRLSPEGGIIDISAFLDKETGVLDWPDAPAGHWSLCRIGYAQNGVVTKGYNGCFIDHLSREAFDEHWGHTVLPLLEVLTEGERSALKGVMCDSWEHGRAEWTQTFPEEFLARRGYDLTPWLPVLAGVDVGAPGDSARFMRDYNQTISELLADNHYKYQKEVANRYGMISVAEAAGPHQWQGDVRMMQGRCDVCMGEFWMPSGHRPLDPQRFMLRDAANAAHVYGIGEVLAESFTTINTYWVEYPATMKPCADRAFCDGLTRVCYHGMMLSPSLVDKPGKIRNAGSHYNPQNTWFEQSGAFNLYLSRCSRMLSEGRFNADCMIYAGDAVKLFAALKTTSEALGYGYDYDYCPTELLMEARVENGRIVLPSGMSYKVLKLSERNPGTALNMKPGYKTSLPEYPAYHYPMTQASVEKILSLVEDGAVLLGERPEGPVAMNDSAEAFEAAADKLWNFSGSFHKVGKGYVFTDKEALLEWLQKHGCGRDFSVPEEMQTRIDWIHRTMPGLDIYFVSNQGDSPVRVPAQFRTQARTAEIWDPVTGGRHAVKGVSGAFELELPAYGSAFILFHKGTKAVTTGDAEEPAVEEEVKGPWTLSFDRGRGGPEEPVMLEELKDWTAFEDPGIKYYSGTATYSSTFDLPDDALDVTIDLGSLNNIAEVYVDGKACGTVWTAPYEATVHGLAAGGHTLEVAVTNLWPNRLIYDSTLPEKERLTHTNLSHYTSEDKPLPSGLYGPVRVSYHRGM